MATILEVREGPGDAALPPSPAGRTSRLARWRTPAICAAIIVTCSIATAFNVYGNPVRFKDEGVYLAQAWAIPNLGALAHYTYWYDHPPLGWIQMSLWATVTDGWDRWNEQSTMAGREFMIVARVATSLLIYALGRRVGLRRSWAVIAVLVFLFSPLAMYYGRLTLLDNVAMPWVLASLVLAWSPRRAWGAGVGSALCFAVAVLTKETLLLLAPAIVLAIWSNYRRSNNRQFVWVAFGLVLAMSAALYPLYALIKSELTPGAGHVSLLGALDWQLSARKGSGSVFDASSDARTLVDSWLALDAWLPVGGLVAAALLVGDRRLRPIVLALAIQSAMLLRQGYLPSMYVVAMLPFCALAVAGLCDRMWTRTADGPATVPLRSDGRRRQRWRPAAAVAGSLAVVVFWCVAITVAGSGWSNTLEYQWTVDADASQRQVTAWLRDNVPHDANVVAEGEMWLDLHNAGFDGHGNIWVYKVDSDPEVTQRLGSWQAIDYLALSRVTLVSESKATMPMVFEALDHAEPVAEFGSANDAVVIMRVDP
ncbi:glycosyltransferase family 39 protein [Mycolicibacterium sediminis]|uniref:Glycosyltransferase RgtA/B/C/D-like domain-containing protein n=1 Tax=Mycolicibacterium sediminis TaxID=1286180 RepID=A0A7I7QPA5_9MYCO|nr:glycosyltransferase family 39 protein [Mycolicibacterium sediminis]BBY28218.1 hypothetical protein MSEDJ_23140 [Mycolicibacterium sediminis]